MKRKLKPKYYVRNCSADHHDCILNHRRELQFLLLVQLSLVDREAERLSRASANLFWSSYLATAIDEKLSRISKL